MSEPVNRFGAPRIALAFAILVLLGVLVFLGIQFMKVAEPPGVVHLQSSGMEWVRSIYGYGSTPEDQLETPYSVAIGPKGDIFVAEPTKAQVVRFSPFGEFKSIVRTSPAGRGQGQFIRPESIAVDTNGDLYIADSWANKVIVFDSANRYVREWQVPSQARGITVSDGEVYVLGVGRVYVYNLAGAQVRQFGSRGKKPGQIDAYQGIAVGNGRVYIADSYNRRIEAFDEHGTLAWSAPSTAATTTSFETTQVTEQTTFEWDLPQDLCLDGTGNLVVADAFLFQLVAVNAKDGSVMGSYGDFGNQDGEFFYPTSVAYDPVRDWFAVADTQNNRVQIVRLPKTSSSPVATAVRRIESSATRYLLVPVLLLLTLLVVSVVQWIRWGRAAGEDVS